ncbi:integrase, partial [Escherichia coli]
DSVDYNWRANGTPPSFHEQRSLSERLFREQGVDTKILLGHSNQKMTDIYNDARGKEWKKTGHLMTSFAEGFCRGFAEKIKNDILRRT